MIQTKKAYLIPNREITELYLDNYDIRVKESIWDVQEQVIKPFVGSEIYDRWQDGILNNTLSLEDESLILKLWPIIRYCVRLKLNLN